MTKKERVIYLQGKIDQSFNLAVWKNGRMVCGVMETPFDKFVEKYKVEQRTLCEELGITYKQAMED